jgi:hypothetical protein
MIEGLDGDGDRLRGGLALGVAVAGHAANHT